MLENEKRFTKRNLRKNGCTMNYTKCVYTIMAFWLALASFCGCVHEQECKSDYENAVRDLEIGPFEFVDASFAEIVNELFVSSNNELEKFGYVRTVGIVAGGISATQGSKSLSVLIPRQSIFSVMVQLAEIMGMEVKFEQGLIRFHGSCVNDENDIGSTSDDDPGES